MKQQIANFSVDVALIEELGQKLVPRKFTALSELIKNSYDADATIVKLSADSLEAGGTIVLSDNGTGISPDAFLRGFLRVATGLKRENRKSNRFERIMAGSKGIGRFAARMLSEVLEIETIWTDGKKNGFKPVGRLKAEIEWDKLNSKSKDLTDIQINYQVSANDLPKNTGTILTLRGLRDSWSEKDKKKLGYDIHFFRDSFRANKHKNSRKEMLNEKEFEIECLGEFEGIEADVEDFYKEAWGVLKLGWDKNGNAKYELDPISFKKQKPNLNLEVLLDTTKTYPENFRPEGEIFLFTYEKEYRAGLLNTRDLQALGREYGGIRVYHNSFRVFPYGEPGDDWAGLTADAAKRRRDTQEMTKILSENYDFGDIELDKALLHIPSANRTFGQISVWEDTTPDLEIMISREGFIANENFSHLIDWVRRGVHWAAVVYYKWSSVYREEKEGRRLGNALIHAPTQFKEAISKIEIASSELRKLARERQIPDDVIAPVDEAIEDSKLRLMDTFATLMTWEAILRVLASRGLQLSAFAHEFRTSRQILDDSVAVLKGYASVLSKGSKKGFFEAIDWIEKASDRIGRQVESFLEPMANIKKERRRKRVFREVLESVVALYQGIAETMGVSIDLKEVDKNIRTVPMFTPELESVIGNLLSNAVKFSGKNGRIRLGTIGGKGSFFIENTGIEVDIKDSEKWFSPFESTSIPDEFLGTGTGLGLTIVRDIVNQYQAQISFRRPSQNYKTRIEVVFQ
ncbi:MAG: sensor histidine kinase [Gammaproteobacteria bacterium]|nr:sensor histidine kinase [Gammaproteobacteria bacterium]